MAAMHEIHSFVNKFLNLCHSGKNADLTLKCKNGKTVINLQLDLDSCPPDAYPHTTPPSHPARARPPYARPSPSRMRRTARRARARNDSAENVAVIHSTSPTEAEKSAIENVDASILLITDAAVKNTIKETIHQNDEKSQPEDQATAEKEVHEVDPDPDQATGEKDVCEVDPREFDADLVCNFCDQVFRNEVVLQEHTEIDHNTRRARFRRL